MPYAAIAIRALLASVVPYAAIAIRALSASVVRTSEILKAESEQEMLCRLSSSSSTHSQNSRNDGEVALSPVTCITVVSCISHLLPPVEHEI